MAENRYPHRLPRKSCRLNGFLDVKNGFFNSHVHVQNMLRITIWLGFPEFKLIHLCILWFIGCSWKLASPIRQYCQQSQKWLYQNVTLFDLGSNRQGKQFRPYRNRNLWISLYSFSISYQLAKKDLGHLGLHSEALPVMYGTLTAARSRGKIMSITFMHSFYIKVSTINSINPGINYTTLTTV